MLAPLIGAHPRLPPDGGGDLDLPPLPTPSGWTRLFRRLQLVSAGLYSLGHGGNDAQKTMGIITGLLIATGHLPGTLDVPLWVILISHVAIALGTMFGGWRIVKTMGSKITKLQPMGGFCAETSGAITLVGATLSGIPVSTTHTITGAIIGVGATTTAERGQVGRRHADRLGLGPDHPPGRLRVGPHLSGDHGASASDPCRSGPAPP